MTFTPWTSNAPGLGRLRPPPTEPVTPPSVAGQTVSVAPGGTAGYVPVDQGNGTYIWQAVGAGAGVVTASSVASALPVSVQQVAKVGAMLNGQIAVTNSGTVKNLSSGATNQLFTSRQSFMSGPEPVTDLVLWYDNWVSENYASGGDASDTLPSATFKAAIEYNNKSYPVFFPGGASTVTAAHGATFCTLPLGIVIPANTAFYVRTAYQAGSGSLYYLFPLFAVDANGDGWTAGDVTANYGPMANSFVPYGAVGPTTITGVPIGSSARQILIIGDSVANGYLDSVPNRGYIRCELGNNFCTIDLGVNGDTVAAWTQNLQGRRSAYIAGADYAIEEYGNNDLFVLGATAATVEANRVQLWKYLASRTRKGVFATTLTPETTSTDNWSTTTNQSKVNPTQDAQRISLNTWLRAGAPLDPTALTPVAVGTPGAVLCNVYAPTTGTITVAATGSGHPLTPGGVFDPAMLAESSLNSGLWTPHYVGPNDGLHPNGTGVPALAPSIITSVLT